MRKYEQLAKDIIQNIGGAENVNSLTHCITRLRFKLKDESKANDDILKNMDGIVTVMHSAGQYQVVIGNHVPEVYDDVCRIADIGENQSSKVKEKKSLKNSFIDMITALFMPSISILCACGLIKAIDSIMQFAGIYSSGDGIAVLMAAIGDCAFFFFPILIGYNAAKKFGLDGYLGIMIGAALCYPTINGTDLNIFGISYNVTYTATVFPIILTVAFAAPLERFLKKVIPDVVKTFFVPTIVLLVSSILGFMLIGPVANVLSDLLSSFTIWTYNLNPTIAGIFIGAVWQVMVVFGIHMAIIVIGITNIINGTPDPIMALPFFTQFATGAVVFAIWMKTKNKKLKEISLPAFISCIFGVTEPAVYGVTLPRIKMFVITCIGGAVSGAIVGATGMKYNNLAGLGIFEFPALLPADNISSVFVPIAIAFVVSIAVSFILAYIFFKDEDDIALQNDEKEKTKTLPMKKEKIYSPVKGTVKKLEESKDDAFAQGVLGKGVLMLPSEGKIYAPFDGTVMALFPTNHAIGIVSEGGCEILIHIGIDTVQLGGKYFTSNIEMGMKVKKGDLLVNFDIDGIIKEGFSIETPVIISNSDDYVDIIETSKKQVTKDNELLTAVI